MSNLIQSDIGSTLVVTCQDQDGNPIDLSTVSSVVLQYYFDSYPPIYNKNMTVNTPATSGVAQYTFQLNDLSSSGNLIYRVVITYPDGNVLTSSGFNQIVVLPQIA